MPFLDETGVQNMTADIKALADVRYLKVGDPSIRNLTESLKIKATELDASTASVDTWGDARLEFYDSNNTLMGYLDAFRLLSNTQPAQGVQFVSSREINNTTIYNGFYLGVKDDATPFISFSSNDVRDAWAKSLNVVKKSGDTMTGDLNIEKSAPTFNEKGSYNTRINATAPSSLTKIGGIRFFDNNNEANFYTETQYTTTQQLYSSFITRRYNADGSTYTNHGFYQRIENDGTLIVDFPSKASRKAWCTGLGVGDYVSKTLGTSGTQSVAHNTVVNLTNIALSPGVWVVMGKISYATGGSTASGYRSCYIGNSTSNDTYASQQLPGATGGNTAVAAMGLVTLSAASTVYLNAKQYSGGALNVNKAYTFIQAVKIRTDL